MRRGIVIALVIGLLAPALPLGAQETPKATPIRAKSLDELLRIVRQGRQADREENRRREAEFLAAKQEQQRLLREAKAKMAAEERRSQEYENSFQANELKLADLEQQLRNRLGSLGELFGVVRQVAGDTRGIVESSIVSAQFPGRDKPLGELAASRKLPSIDQLERLWYFMQQEMTEAGKVVEFPATVVSVDGERVEREVTRIGVFNAVADGRYLQFPFETKVLTELGRQPARSHLSTLGNLDDPDNGRVTVALDPSRGQILNVLIQTPGAWERIQQGKIVGYIIIFLGTLGVLFSIVQFLYLLLESRKVRSQLGRESADSGNALGRVLAVYEENRQADPETLDLKLDEAVLKETPRLERFLSTIRVLSVVAPLLGLLGTVTGMINTFQVMTLFGTGDPKMMAGGISEALVTTMLGLCVAIPLVLLHSFVSGRSRAILHILEEQTAGIVAERAEARDNHVPA